MGRPAGCSHDLTIRRRRQERIALLAGRGWTQPEIAIEMRIDIRTVQRYYAAIREGRQPRTRGPKKRSAVQLADA